VTLGKASELEFRDRGGRIAEGGEAGVRNRPWPGRAPRRDRPGQTPLFAGISSGWLRYRGRGGHCRPPISSVRKGLAKAPAPRGGEDCMYRSALSVHARMVERS